MAKVAIEDLSGTTTPTTSNPYDGLINACHDDPGLIQARYQHHRTTRNEQQKSKILSNEFKGWILDEHLVKLQGRQCDPEYADPRHCLVFWARPTDKVKHLIKVIQQKLQIPAPELWLMPLENLHMTTMEINHSLTAHEIESLVKALAPSHESIADHPNTHKARLIKPLVSYDSAALALSFVPASAESLPEGRTPEDDRYTYHHLRRDIYQAITDTGVVVGSRYVVPSAHLTIARFNSPNVFDGDPMDASIALDVQKRKHWVKEIEMINKWLEAEFWPEDGRPIKPGGEWIVGEEKGLDFRKGTLWYGGGETIYRGSGFNL